MTLIKRDSLPVVVTSLCIGLIISIVEFSLIAILCILLALLLIVVLAKLHKIIMAPARNRIFLVPLCLNTMIGSSKLLLLSNETTSTELLEVLSEELLLLLQLPFSYSAFSNTTGLAGKEDAANEHAVGCSLIVGIANGLSL